MRDSHLRIPADFHLCRCHKEWVQHANPLVPHSNRDWASVTMSAALCALWGASGTWPPLIRSSQRCEAALYHCAHFVDEETEAGAWSVTQGQDTAMMGTEFLEAGAPLSLPSLAGSPPPLGLGGLGLGRRGLGILRSSDLALLMCDSSLGLTI